MLTRVCMALVLLLAAWPVEAGDALFIYKYTDEAGQQHITDDPRSIPEALRSKVEVVRYAGAGGSERNEAVFEAAAPATPTATAAPPARKVAKPGKPAAAPTPRAKR